MTRASMCVPARVPRAPRPCPDPYVRAFRVARVRKLKQEVLQLVDPAAEMKPW